MDSFKWKKLVGVALLWVALASAAFVPSAEGAVQATLAAALGFASFATGLSLYTDGVSQDITQRLKAGQTDARNAS